MTLFTANRRINISSLTLYYGNSTLAELVCIDASQFNFFFASLQTTIKSVTNQLNAIRDNLTREVVTV